MCTGKLHGAAMGNDEEVEAMAVEAGKHSGDLVFPILYCPELYRKEFASKVADMRNSVKVVINRGWAWYNADDGLLCYGSRRGGWGVFWELKKALVF